MENTSINVLAAEGKHIVTYVEYASVKMKLVSHIPYMSNITVL
jgi:hypothetical protein